MLERKHVIAVAAAVLVGLGLAAVPAAPATAVVSSAAVAGQPTLITGSGSAWAADAMDEWIAGFAQAGGGQVVYTADGSAAGRADYQLQVLDFAASDEPYRHGWDNLANVGPERTPVGYSYVPLVAGSIAFMYHLRVHGHKVTNLRLSGETILKIFTGQITNWDNPAITHDYGSQLPSMPIVPVTPAGSAGSTYYFTNWLAHVHPRQWNAFCDSVRGIRPPCGPTVIYPQVGNAQAADGSTGVANDVTSTNGAIGYDEYSYALQAGIPVVYLRNPAGRYVLPLAANVTTALREVVINEHHASPEFLEENLDGVYTYKNPTSYPLSYYGYWIVPRSGTTLPAGFTSADGDALSKFVYYGLCVGQQYLAPLGYAPLTGKLIRNGLNQVRRIPGHIPMPPLSHCHDLPH